MALIEFGLVLYRYPRSEEDVNTASNLEDTFVLHNTMGKEINSNDFVSAFEKRTFSCPRCQKIYDHARELLVNIPSIQNKVLGICNHCLIKERSLYPCHKCLKIVNEFTDRQYEQERHKRSILRKWLTKAGTLSASVSTHQIRTKIKRTSVDINVDNLCRNTSLPPRKLRQPDVEEFLQPDKKNTDIIYVLKNKDAVIHSREKRVSLVSPSFESNVFAEEHDEDGYEFLKRWDKRPSTYAPIRSETDLSKNKLVHDTKNIFKSWSNLHRSSQSLPSKKKTTEKNDFLYIFPKTKKEKTLQLRSVVSSSELLKDVQDKIQEGLIKTAAEKEKKRLAFHAKTLKKNGDELAILSDEESETKKKDLSLKDKIKKVNEEAKVQKDVDFEIKEKKLSLSDKSRKANKEAHQRKFNEQESLEKEKKKGLDENSPKGHSEKNVKKLEDSNSKLTRKEHLKQEMGSKKSVNKLQPDETKAKKHGDDSGKLGKEGQLRKDKENKLEDKERNKQSKNLQQIEKKGKNQEGISSNLTNEEQLKKGKEKERKKSENNLLQNDKKPKKHDDDIAKVAKEGQLKKEKENKAEDKDKKKNAKALQEDEKKSKKQDDNSSKITKAEQLKKEKENKAEDKDKKKNATASQEDEKKSKKQDDNSSKMTKAEKLKTEKENKAEDKDKKKNATASQEDEKKSKKQDDNSSKMTKAEKLKTEKENKAEDKDKKKNATDSQEDEKKSKKQDDNSSKMTKAEKLKTEKENKAEDKDKKKNATASQEDEKKIKKQDDISSKMTKAEQLKKEKENKDEDKDKKKNAKASQDDAKKSKKQDDILSKMAKAEQLKKEKEKKAEEIENIKNAKILQEKQKQLVNSMTASDRNTDDLISKLIKKKKKEVVPLKREKPKTLSELNVTIKEIHRHKKGRKGRECRICEDSELDLDIQRIFMEQDKFEEAPEIIIGENIYKFKPCLMESGDIAEGDEPVLVVPKPESETKPPVAKSKVTPETETPKGIIRYALSDRTFIEKGWTMLPTEKVVRKMNVYRMRPAHPEFDWFEHNKKKKFIHYDSGEKFAEFDEDGATPCRWFYKNGRLALNYYDAEELNASQRFVVYSSGEKDERGRSQPITVLATFDYLGNGVVFDHAGKIRLKYNQTEGVVLDRSLGPVSNWKWHTLNDPPVLQPVMIDTQMAHKDPNIYKMAGPNDNKPRPDDEEMLAIEFDNFIKEKNKKLTQKFKPFQIRMKAMKINEHFSLKVLDQATIYLIYRDGPTIVKLNLGMLLDHQEIIDTDTAEVGEVSNNMERLPAKTDSLAGLQRSVAHAQRFDHIRLERDKRLRPPEATASVDQLKAGISKPLRPVFRTASSVHSACESICSSKRSKFNCNVYYNTRV